MKKLLLLMLGAATTMSVAAGTNWTLQSKAYTVDTLYHAKIGPGTTQTTLQLGGAQKLRVFYTTTDLTNPYVDIRVTKGSNKYVGCQVLSAQRTAADKPGARYFAGVNADFFGNSAPIGSTVVDGEVINTVNNTWVNWYMTEDKMPHIAALGYNGTATFPGGATHTVSGINIYRDENYLVVYNKKFNGTTTGTNAYGQEVTIVPVESDLTFNGKSRYKVTCAPLGAGSMAIPAGGYVLSGHGTAAALVKALQIGDEVSLDLYPSLGDKKITQMASGLPIILQNGVTLNTQSALDHLTALNPRTAVGYGDGGKKLVLLVVDGRSGNSVGVVSRVLADIMREVGCTDAMNFDGGGSSELYTSAFGVRNSPSDGKERAVTNAAWCVCTAPDDNTVAEIAFAMPTVTLPKYGFYVPQLYAYNKYGLLINTELTGATLSCDTALGEVSEDGATLFANGAGTHVLKATYNGISCTVPVTIGSGMPEIRLSSVVLDGFRDYVAEVTGTVGDLTMPVDNRAMTWTSDNPDVATVDQTGRIQGVSTGEAVISAKVDNYVGTLPVIVQKPESHRLTIDTDRENSAWSLTKTGIKDENLTHVDADRFDVGYTVSSTRGTKITVKMAADLYSLPDSIRLVMNPGDCTITKLTVDAGHKGDRPTSVSYEPTFTANKMLVMNIPVSDFVDDVNDFANYPLTLTSLSFTIGDAVAAKKTFSVHQLQSVYNNVTDTEGVEDIVAADNDACGNGVDVLVTPDGRMAGANPAPGLYIERRGNTVRKVVVRR